MPPEAIMIMVIVAILCGTAMIASIVKSAFGYAKSRQEKNLPTGSSLTTGELERLVRKAVEEATEPLHDRIDTLELRLIEQKRLAAPGEVPLRLPEEEADVEATLSQSARRRTR